MIFRNTGLQKEKCPDCKGMVFCDPIGKDGSIIAYKIICSGCGKTFDENEWPPKPQEC